jgi:hypothetical protein
MLELFRIDGLTDTIRHPRTGGPAMFRDAISLIGNKVGKPASDD